MVNGSAIRVIGSSGDNGSGTRLNGSGSRVNRLLGIMVLLLWLLSQVIGLNHYWVWYWS